MAPRIDPEKKARFAALRPGDLVVVVGYLVVASDNGSLVPVPGDMGRVLSPVSPPDGLVEVAVPGKERRGEYRCWRFYTCYPADDLRLATFEEKVAFELLHADEPAEKVVEN